LYRTAERYARREILADSTVAEGHTWLAAALGNIAMFEGSKAKVTMCHEIKKELETAIVLNPDDDVAYSILGSFYLALGSVSWIERQLAAIFLGGLPDGGYKESETALKTAIKIAPDVVRHHFELGELYVKEDRIQEAIGEFQTATLLPVALASDEHTQALAAERINQLGAQR
jgi:tetratricopeptide (TPR) repeat protein